MIRIETKGTIHYIPQSPDSQEYINTMVDDGWFGSWIVINEVFYINSKNAVESFTKRDVIRIVRLMGAG